MHRAEAGARFFGLSREELWSHARETQFFARKNTDSVFAMQMMSVAAMQKYARRWGESTISEIWLARASAPCSENLISLTEAYFYRVLVVDKEGVTRRILIPLLGQLRRTPGRSGRSPDFRQIFKIRENCQF